MITNEETFEGSGVLQCFGNMTVSLLFADSKEGDGTAKCRPLFEDPNNGIPIAPQGFIADGEDGSHWVRSLIAYLGVCWFVFILFHSFTGNVYLNKCIFSKVVVDDYGTADCVGHIYYRTGDDGLGFCHYIPKFGKNQSLRTFSAQFLSKYQKLLSFCGFFTCTGEIKLICTMNIGCHGGKT